MKIHKKKANKNYICMKCNNEIKKGEDYLSYSPRYSGKKIRCTNCYPKPSELTSSDKLSRLYSIQEELETLNVTDDESMFNVAQVLSDKASEARDIAEEYRDSVSNMPENLQYSSKADELNEKADSIDSWADELDDASNEIDYLANEIISLKEDRMDTELNLESKNEELDNCEEPDEEDDIHWQKEEFELRLSEIENDIEEKISEANDKINDVSQSLCL